MRQSRLFSVLSLVALALSALPVTAFASEAELRIPELNLIYSVLGIRFTGTTLLEIGLLIAALGIGFGLMEFRKIKRLPVHLALEDVSTLIYETCKAYMVQQGKFLVVLQLLVGAAIVYYFGVLQNLAFGRVLLILFWSVLGVLGSFGVAMFGMRINNYANSRTAMASLEGKPYPVMEIPLRAGMSIGILLVCVELILLLAILLFVPRDLAGACFIGFAIGESLGASALRICGGIFTKIADIGSDLMKIVFNIKEDDARNPGVIADCVGDNAGDSVGPTADGFETYGVTNVALISFLVLAAGARIGSDGALLQLSGATAVQGKLIIWIFAMSIQMIIVSIAAYLINGKVSKARFAGLKNFNFETPLTTLLWTTCILSILATYLVSYVLIGDMSADLWWRLASIISCGTLAAGLIPELTKVFTSTKSRHVEEIIAASREGGASLTILSGLVAGNFSAFWKGMAMVALMTVAYQLSGTGMEAFMVYPSVFAFGLVAFGFLSMAPVNIAVDSYGPVTDNAQSVFELSLIETLPNIGPEIERQFGYQPDFETGKLFLEQNDGAGNTFKATAKPVLIGTAVIGATTLIFATILLLRLKLDLLDARVILGLMTGGAVIYWFTGASMQAVTTGAYRAVEFIKKNIRLEGVTKASVEDSKEVVKICTQYAQMGMINIFGVIFSFTLAFACFDPTFFAAYLISIAVFGLFQAIFMANAGGAWDNAKKVVEVDLRAKGTPLHAATVIADTVGDPFKDTSSVALNPIIKFTTLFGLLAAEIAVSATSTARYVGVVFFLVGLFFVYRSFYGMRIGGAGKSA